MSKKLVKKDLIRAFFLEKMNQAYETYVNMNVEHTEFIREFRKRVIILLNERLISWAIIESDGNVYITPYLIHKLRMEKIKGDMIFIADLLDWEYIVEDKYYKGHIKVNIDDFVYFIYP